MLRLESDLLEIMLAVVQGTLAETEIRWCENAVVGVVLASAGYPGAYQTGLPIKGLETLDEDVEVFHAGTRLEEGRLLTAGGRVLTVVAAGPTLAEARAKVYDNVPRVRFEGMHYRTDIALRELEPRA